MTKILGVVVVLCLLTAGTAMAQPSSAATGSWLEAVTATWHSIIDLLVAVHESIVDATTEDVADCRGEQNCDEIGGGIEPVG